MWRRLEPLAGYTTFRIGGPADWFVEPRTEGECLTVWHQTRKLGKPTYVLGGGSNLLVADEGVRGIVISLRRMCPRRVERRGNRVHVSAGVPLARLLSWAAREGLGGLECLAGIPGLVGGAVAMNAGGRTGTLGERVVAIQVIDPTGRRRRVPGHKVGWEYRSANLRGRVVLEVELSLLSRPPEEVMSRTRKALEAKRASQPLGAWSAGCVFRNPLGRAAGRLIDQAGLKGARNGDAEISNLHANFIVNRGHATAANVMQLVERARRTVRSTWKRQLTLEIQYWPHESGR
jgi:UDP-N-acetylmuramate dehydrogenase